MKITEIQAKIVHELMNQGAEKNTINGIMDFLKTEEQQKEFYNYLLSIKDKQESESNVIMKALVITGRLKIKNDISNQCEK